MDGLRTGVRTPRSSNGCCGPDARRCPSTEPRSLSHPRGSIASPVEPALHHRATPEPVRPGGRSHDLLRRRLAPAPHRHPPVPSRRAAIGARSPSEPAPSTGAGVSPSSAVARRRSCCRGRAGGCARSGAHPSQPPSAARPSSTTSMVTARPGDSLWSIVERIAPARTRARWSTSSRRPATARRSVPGEAGRRSRRLGRTHRSPPRRGRIGGAAPGYRGGDALSRTAQATTTRWSTRGRPTTGRRSGAGGSAWRAAAATPPTSVRRGRRCSWSSARGHEPFDRAKLRAGIERAVAGPADRAPSAVDARRRRGRGARRGQGPEVRSERRPGRARAAADARPGLVPALRLRLQGLRGRRRLRAEVVELQKTHRPRSAASARATPTFEDLLATSRRQPLTRWNFSAVIHPRISCRLGGSNHNILWLSVAPTGASGQATMSQRTRDRPRAGEGRLARMAMAPEQIGIGIRRYFTQAGRPPVRHGRVGAARRPHHRTTRTAPTPSSSPASSSRSTGRRTPPTSSPRSTSAARLGTPERETSLQAR